jgi:hypothetical protein
MLLYTLALDLPETLDQRLMAKMLAGSLLRNYFAGTVVVVRNSPEPLFRLLREGLEEIYAPEETRLIGFGRESGTFGRHEIISQRQTAAAWKVKAHALFDAAGHDIVLYADADCVTLRGIEHLVEEGAWDIRYLPSVAGERGEPAHAVSSAVWGVRGGLCAEVMREWERRMAGLRGDEAKPDHAAWSSLINDCRSGRLPWRALPFEAHEIVCPLEQPLAWPRVREAALLHCTGLPTGDRIDFMFAMYMRKYFSDPRGTLLNLLDM